MFIVHATGTHLLLQGLLVIQLLFPLEFRQSVVQDFQLVGGEDLVSRSYNFSSLAPDFMTK
jgi:hypothetical protein